MHETMQRLFDYAVQTTAGTAEPIRELPDLMNRLEVSAGRFTNWKSRGISKEGALKAEAELGCPANWVMTGQGAPSHDHVGVSKDVGEDPRRNIVSSASEKDYSAALAPEVPPSADMFTPINVANVFRLLGGLLASADLVKRGMLVGLIQLLITHPEQLEKIAEAAADTVQKKQDLSANHFVNKVLNQRGAFVETGPAPL